MALSRKQLKFFLPVIDNKILRDLPDRPGVYRMINAGGIVIYVGKAVSLRQRVRSYFTRGDRHADHIFRMASKVKRIDYTVTGSVLEAAVLEADEIKKLSPAYNIALRDKNKQMWYASSDLAEYRPEPGNKCTIGPVTTPVVFKVLTIVKNLITGMKARPAEDIEFLLRMIPARYAEYSANFEIAWSEFCDQYLTALRGPGSYGERIVLLGKELWLRDRLAASVSGGKDGDENENQNEDTPAKICGNKQPVLTTPAVIRKAVESRIVYSTWEIRRLRWYSLLAESSLAWTERVNRKYKRRVIVVEKGIVTQGDDLAADRTIPVPPGHWRKRAERQRSLDRSAIDRMKVLTSEMKRIITSRRWICLRLSPKVIMDRDRIARTLKWI
ncbi:MAG TPA: nucleotide excision repair endonuclease [bacterium]